VAVALHHHADLLSDLQPELALTPASLSAGCSNFQFAYMQVYQGTAQT